MIFVKFTFSGWRIFSFCLDDLVSFEMENLDDTKIELRNGRSEVLEIEINDFCAKIFSDEHGGKEYELIEIESDRPTQFNFPTGMDQVV